MTAPLIPPPAKPETPPAPTSSPTTTPASGSPPATPTSPAPAPAPAPAAPQSPWARLSPEEKDRLLSVYSGQLQNQKSELDDLRSRVDEIGKKQDAPPAPDPKAVNQEFYNRPVEMVTDIVRKEVSAAIAPLTDFVRSAGSRTEYDRIKEELKTDPRVKDVFDRSGAYVDQLIAQQAKAGQKITRDTVVAAVAGVRGALELGWLGDGTSGGSAPPAPATPAPTGGSMVTPPHLRPSAPPAPGASDTKPQLRDLTENEERLRRENKMTKEEFLGALDMAAHDVTNINAWPKKEGAK